MEKQQNGIIPRADTALEESNGETVTFRSRPGHSSLFFGRKDHDFLELNICIDPEDLEAAHFKLSRLSPFLDATDEPICQEKLSDLARGVYQSRRLRTRFFDDDMFGEPAWDMLLALFGFSARGEVMCVSSLCYASEVPFSTALRHIRTLENKGLIARSKDTHDGRRIFVSLTAQGITAMSGYIVRVQRVITG